MKNKSSFKPLLIAAVFLAGCEGATEPEQEQKPQFELDAVYQTEIQVLSEKPSVMSAKRSLEAHDTQNLSDLIELTEIPAPPFAEEKRAAHFAGMLKAAGLPDVKVDEVGNVIGRRPGREGKRVLALVAHLDTVFPAGTDVTVRVDGNTYHAPGIGDNTRGLVFLLSLLRVLEAEGIETRDDILFIGSVGEEGLGDLRGVKHLFREDGPQIDSFIAIDGGGNDRLIYGGVGSHRYKVIVSGPGGHSWGAFGLANPHHAMGRAIENFADRAPAVTSVGPKTSFSIGRIGGGTSINSIPFESWMEVDMRSVDQMKLDEIDAVFQKAVLDGIEEENNARKDGAELTVDIKRVGKRPAGVGDPSGPLVQRAMAAMLAVGVTAKPSMSSTDSNIPISLGIPAITISRGGISRRAHAPDESWTDANSHVAIQTGLLLVLAQAGLEAEKTE